MNRAWIALWALTSGAAAAQPAADAAAPTPAAAVLAAGSAQAGRELFAGVRPFRNGGAPCGACHGLGGEGLAFTASFGPELSAGLTGLDPEAIDGLIESLPFPSMAPVYEGRALTPEERADLVAFLVEAVKQGPPAAGWRFEVLGLVGAALGFLALAVAWGRRKAPSRARLLARAHHSPGGSP
jgi:mono/diheme cytochrome c family protein